MKGKLRGFSWHVAASFHLSAQRGVGGGGGGGGGGQSRRLSAELHDEKVARLCAFTVGQRTLCLSFFKLLI